MIPRGNYEDRERFNPKKWTAIRNLLKGWDIRYGAVLYVVYYVVPFCLIFANCFGLNPGLL